MYIVITIFIISGNFSTEQYVMNDLYSVTWLELHKIPYRIIKLSKAPRSAQDVVELFGCPLSHVIKTLLFTNDKHVIVCLPGDKNVNIEKLKKLLNISVLKIASPQEVEHITGYKIGSVTPFIKSTENNIEYVLDRSCLIPQRINIGSGLPEVGLEIESKDLHAFWPGIIGDIT
jgi:prolyl-tRNA editing enzyme YbaK/EbsC (Cys-tRNA(Pro) deacylase)